MRDCSFDTHIFKEGDAYVAFVPALDVSSCGATEEQARHNIRDAVRGFLAACADMGTLDEILQFGSGRELCPPPATGNEEPSTTRPWQR